jgi:hypothetical protein
VRPVSRQRALVVYALVGAATVVLFVVIVAVREDTALVGALSAAGTVAAGVFAALAAMGSMRAAADSSATARRSREALARSVRPRVRPAVRASNGTLLGEVRVDGTQAASDVMAVWLLTGGGGTRTERAAYLEPPVAGVAPGPGLTVDLGLPEDADVAASVEMVWLEYWDAGHTGQWRDTWKVGTDPGDRGSFHQQDSELVD